MSQTDNKAKKAKESGGHELKIPDITVPQRLTHPHPFVRAVRDQIKKRAQGVKRRRVESNEKMPALKVFPTSIRRGLRILQATVQAAEKLGWTVHEGENRREPPYLMIEEERVHVRIIEKARRVEAPDERWRKYRYEPTGNLRLEFPQAYAYNGRKTWKDDPQKRIEGHIGAFLRGAYHIAQFKKENRQRREKTRRQQKKVKQKKKIRRRREAEEARRDALEQQAGRYRKVQDLRAYIREVQSRAAKEPLSQERRRRLEEWVEWAEAHTDRIDPLDGRFPFDPD